MTEIAWQPTAPLANLTKRAQLLANIRAFFAKRHVMEVETPLLASHGVTNPNIASITAHIAGMQNEFYLQTSPEYAMKRLLAAGSGAIYQICKAFRNGEIGKKHNPEFTMLEWYRPGFNHLDLMDEMDVFLRCTLEANNAERLSYKSLFERYLDINPLNAEPNELRQCAERQGINVTLNASEANDKDIWLDLLMTHCIEYRLGHGNTPTFVYDFPASQAALARIRHEGAIGIAERFEVYINGMEIANGFHELNNAHEQRLRFQFENQQRQSKGLPEIAIDEYLIAALEHGMPDCAGVAVGVDRLAMCLLGVKSLDKAIAFDVSNS